MPKPDCCCAQFPRLRLSTPIAIVQHVRERFKPTNTGRAFARMTEGTMVLPCGMRGQTFDPAPLGDPSIEWRLLFPRAGAPVIDLGRRSAEGRRPGLVLLDASWRQCSHMSRRIPSLAALPCFTLPAGTPSFWTVRTQHLVEGRSTFEAALAALQGVEEAPAIDALRHAFAGLTARLLHLKGKLPSPEVPAAWGL
jgi:DTW domain-containing protein YfiP